MTDPQLKKPYTPPRLASLGSVTQMTLKTKNVGIYDSGANGNFFS